MSERITGRDVFQATEAATDDDGTWITIIKEGRSVNGRNYRRSTLDKAVKSRVYENIRMFVDHSDKPPLKRSIKELVSGIGETKLDTSFEDGKARVRGKVLWFNDDFERFAEKAKDHIGVSHDALLRGTRSIVAGRRFEDIDEIKTAHSVDWVVYPSAGGGFEQFIAQEGVEMADIDWDAIDEEMLKQHKPDLYQALVTRAQEDEDDDEEEPEVPDPDPDNAPAPSGITERQVESIVMRVFEQVETKRTKQQNVHGQVAATVNKSTLPEKTKARIIRSFENIEEYDEEKVTEAISEAKEELAAVAGPRIRNMGPSGKSGKSASLGRVHEAVAGAFGMKPTPKNEENE